MVDVVLSIRDAGHRAGFVAVSRHGLLPLSHRDWPARPPVVEPPRAIESWDGSAGEILRMVREASRAASRSGLDWRDVINGLRSATPSLWRRMPAAERARFVRHVRPYWETHRHRMSTRIAEEINGMIARRELQVVAGRLTGCVREGDAVVTEARLRNGGTVRHRVGVVVNCTGPDADYARVRDPLVVSLRERGLLTPDPLALGFLTDEGGAMIDNGGRASTVLFALGSPRRTEAWESTAVPELRSQADHLSRRLKESLAVRS
jgi:uncharacterized NAD(P)/FAD-binding protein YdhS